MAAHAFAVPATTGNVIATTGPVKVNGISIYCTAAGDGVILRDGSGTGRILMAAHAHSATMSVNVTPDDGVIAPSGTVHATVVGTTAPIGSVWIQ